MSQAKEILTLLKSARSRVDLQRGVYISIALASVATTLLAISSIPAFRLPWYAQLAVIPLSWITVACLAFLLWLAYREAYWRRGSGHRVGFCVCGDGVKDDHIESAIRGFEKLHNKLTDHVRIIYFPQTLIETDTKRHVITKRYRLDSVYQVIADVPIDNNSPGLVFRIAYRSAVRESFIHEFHEQYKRGADLLQCRPQIESLGINELLESQGRTVFQVLLSSIAFVDFANGKLDRASVLLRALDEDLGYLDEKQPPRLTFRHLELTARCVSSAWPGANPPGPDALREAIESAESAKLYLGSQFPIVYSVLTRNYFYYGDLEKSTEYASRYLDSNPTGQEEGNAHLNAAVIQLCRGNWGRASDHLTRFIKISDQHVYNF